MLFQDPIIAPHNKHIDLTINQQNQLPNFSIGRASYGEQLHLWDKKTGKLTDFTTDFSFVINPSKDNPNRGRGDGLAFFLTNISNSDISNSIAGGGLGLFNYSPHTSFSNSIVVVEFDTWKNDWDPDDNHIGININSIVFVKNVTCNTIIKKATGKASARVTYNSSSKLLSVFLTYD
ncbi:2-acetamido-2-deoxy-D-galactose-binding seed lectin 2-like [Macadamia integrifolia]|uniref:2-acetamido-2-deoxy-D-galactose-binding seed lectin 2-like n=1 Tax=Macadamia integrifolia TaxID=60698 RepID=UPI001C4E990A|nr:2-acetamido-2-deoxy-D-galactose-binding seed lectin 2-like [Macadamia integrifolia]